MARWNDHLPRQARDERNKINTRMTDWHVAGRQVHADPSNVTMSFWTTPDSANLDPKTVRASLSLSLSLFLSVSFWSFYSGNVSSDVCFVLSLSWQLATDLKRRGREKKTPAFHWCRCFFLRKQKHAIICQDRLGTNIKRKCNPEWTEGVAFSFIVETQNRAGSGCTRRVTQQLIITINYNNQLNSTFKFEHLNIKH